MRAAVLFALLLPILFGPSAARSADRQEEPVRLAQVEALRRAWTRTDRWAVKSMILLSLGREWHPRGSAMVLEGLTDRDPRIRAYALEALYRTDPTHLRHVATREILDVLARKGLKVADERYRDRVLAIFGRCIPPLEGLPAKECRKGWDLIRKRWNTSPWEEPPAPTVTGRTVALPFLRRLLDLAENGLELVVVIDSTSSMQGVIDGARDAIVDLVSVLERFCGNLRLGLVTYRDLPDMTGGAAILTPLSRHHLKMRARLDGLQAVGGGDAPEAVERGLELALSRAMGWSRDANRLVILVGDAPPHRGPRTARALELARDGRLDPDKVLNSGRTVTPGKDPTRPFVISAIGVGTRVRSFPEIAKEGGGSYATLRSQSGDEATRSILRHILVLSFGSRWEPQVGEFLDVFLAYRESGFFK